MAIYKCKMCGGTLDVSEGISVIECDFCTTKQTVPTSKDENLQGLFNRANVLRAKSEFDKAEQIYEKILQADETQAEAYWGLILCKYGIEYVEDPKTFNRVPTCHRTSFDSIVADDDYNSALRYADGVQRGIYEAEAKEIDRLQKEILTLSQKEEPYDVFICYKETDATGRRTQDSAIANDIYHQLTQEGFKVFYAAITLEDKLGSAYEPCIFAALNSAKVMLAVGTKPEFFDAVWVKNEWSRFLKMMKNDRNKILIPCYKDMDAYELPEEFAHLQAQDMGKIGFINDIVRGIKKIIPGDEPKATYEKETTVISDGVSANVTALLDRGFMALEDGEWDKADGFFEQVLNFNSRLASAYLGKLMAECKARTQESLKEQKEPFYGSVHYQKIVRFGDDELKKTLLGYIVYINTRNENARLESVYSHAVLAMETAETGDVYEAAALEFESINGYKDSSALAAECREKAEYCRKKAKEEHLRLEEEKKKCVELFSAYKSALRKEKDGRNQIEQANKLVAELTTKFKDLLRIKDKWNKIEENIAKLNKAIQTLQTSISKQENERSNLGLLAVKRKKELTAMITYEEHRLKEANREVAEEEANKQKLGFTSLATLESEIMRVEAEIDAQNDIVGEILSAENAGKIREELIGYEYGAQLLSIYDSLLYAKPGDYIKFGSYTQDNSDHKRTIEWLVLDVKGEKALVISKYALDCKPYNTEDTSVTWETCTLRKWLNNDFINSAFSADEKAMIPTVTVSAGKNPEYSTDPGNATQDQVFLLSITEANKYFGSNSARQCEPTDYAVANGAYVNSDNGNCWWWLRSPGSDQDDAAYVYGNGVVYELGDDVDNDYGAVRPALWIDLNS
ncbi:MAG: TIR domain-containing protein [Clostridia bacterium]|nr:TIR domain-containing protein [Clostridia bacterium]